MRYRDDEGDLITITDQEDLDVAILDFMVDQIFIYTDERAVTSW